MSAPLPEQQICPFLGFFDDPETCHVVPSLRHCCHRARPVAHILLEHQARYCLAAQHAECPIFQGPEGQPVPENLRAPEPRRPSRVRRWWVVVAVILVIVFLVALWYGLRF